MFKSLPRAFAVLGATLLLSVGMSPALAQVIITDDSPFVLDPPPWLLGFASAEPTRYSTAGVEVFYVGSRRTETCDDSFAFWSCRETPYAERLGNSDESVTGRTVSAALGPGDFERTDTGQSAASARASADFRSLRVEAYAAGGLNWEETRVTAASEPTLQTISARSGANAAAVSRWTDVLVPSSDGQITIELSLANHPASFGVAQSVFPDARPREGGGKAALRIQIFNLDEVTQYRVDSQSEQAFPEAIEGFKLVGEALDIRAFDDSPTTTFLRLTFDVAAGQRYSIVNQLSADAKDNAGINLFGTGRLDRILVEPGQVLSFASGVEYDIAVVPAPAALPLLLSGIGAFAVVARRRRAAA